MMVMQIVESSDYSPVAIVEACSANAKFQYLILPIDLSQTASGTSERTVLAGGLALYCRQLMRITRLGPISQSDERLGKQQKSFRPDLRILKQGAEHLSI